MYRKLAATLNFFIWGAGYLYSGERTIMGGLLLAGYVPIHWYWFGTVGVAAAFTGASVIVFIGHGLLSLALAYDVYRAG